MIALRQSTIRKPSPVEQSRKLVELGIGRRRSPPRRATGARQRLAVDIENVRHSAQPIEVDIAEQRPYVRRLAFTRPQQGRQILLGNGDRTGVFNRREGGRERIEPASGGARHRAAPSITSIAAATIVSRAKFGSGAKSDPQGRR